MGGMLFIKKVSTPFVDYSIKEEKKSGTVNLALWLREG